MRCPTAVKLTTLLQLIPSTSCSDVITKTAGEASIDLQLLAHCIMIERGTGYLVSDIFTPAYVQEREPAQDAACLTKFAELLLLNGIISSEQMWSAFHLVTNLFESPGAHALNP